jgi:hypothetical protein
MQHPARQQPGLPQALTYSAAVTFGMLAALAVQIWFSRAGYDLVTLWQEGFSIKAVQLRTAGPWWSMAVAAFIVAGATAAALSRLPPPWSRFRLLRWVLGAAIIVVLADLGHSAAAGPAGEAGGAAHGAAKMAAEVAASLAALILAAALALCGAYFTVRR